MTTRWPTFFIVGAPKSGTTSLYSYLDQHPDVQMAPTKEPHFFSDIYGEGYWDDAEALDKRERDYLALFGDGGWSAAGEASTSYLWYPEAAERIRDKVPDARIVVSLRNPVDRAFSHYLHTVRDGSEDRDFLGAVRHELDTGGPYAHHGPVVTEPGRYATHVERFHEVFGEEQVLVLDFHEWTSDPRPSMERVCEHLGVDPGPVDRIDYDLQINRTAQAKNALARQILDSQALVGLARAVLPFRLRVYLGEEVLKEPDKPQMDPEAAEVLRKLYRPEVARLEELLGRELPNLRV